MLTVLVVQALVACLTVGASLREAATTAARFSFSRVVGASCAAGCAALMSASPAERRGGGLLQPPWAALLVLAALSGASALKYGQPEGYPTIQWFGPNGVPGEVVPLGVPDNRHIPVALRHRAGEVRGYGERPHGADDLYLLYPPALQLGQRRLTDAELLRELRFADGYMPSARYVVLISALGAGGVIDELRWVQTDVANVRRQIQGGLFLQHWYVADPWAYCGGSRDAHYVHDPMDDEDPDDGDFDPGPPARSECDLCGSCFWPDAGWVSTDDWKGAGMSCCGCQSDSCDDGSHVSHSALAYDPRCEVIRFARHSAAARAAEISAGAAAGNGTRRRCRSEPRRSSVERRRGPRASLLKRAQTLAAGSGGTAHRSHGACSVTAGLPAVAPPLAPSATAPPLFSASLRSAAAFTSSAITTASAEASAVVSNYMESKVESNIAAFQADKSRLALRPDDWGLMRGLMSSSNAALERRVPHNTKKQDRCYWRMWSEFCALLNTPPIRDDVEAATGANTALHTRELQLVEACFMYWV